MRFFIVCSLLVICTFSASAQRKNKEILTPKAAAQLKIQEDTLVVLAYAVVNDSSEHVRFGTCRALIQALVRTLQIENSFQYQFERLRTVSILTPPDSSFRIFTWQLFVNDSTYRYYGAIQKNSKKLELFPLIDRSFEYEVFPTYDLLSPEKWYGALYYNIRQFDTKEGRRYFLFGYDGYSFFEKQKVLEVFSFDKAGKPVFGGEVFSWAEPRTPAPVRMHFQYSAEAAIKMNWDEQYQMIIFDHLIEMPSPFGRDMTYVTDGSYDGFKFEKGRWKFIDKVFNDVMTEEFRPEPVLEARKADGNDITGKPKRSRGKQ